MKLAFHADPGPPAPVSSSGSELDHIVYDSFGNIVTETNAGNGDRFKFAGMEYDSTNGQYYDRARFYDSVTGKFFTTLSKAPATIHSSCSEQS